MSATSDSRSATTPTAVGLIAQAVKLLDPNDMRGTLLGVVVEMWDQPATRTWLSNAAEADDVRWSVAALILDHDAEVNEPLVREALSCGVQILDQLEDLICSLGQKHDQRWAVKAREMRVALDRLDEIARAVSAVHLLEAEVAS
jgi:hypothetical protein